MNKKLIMLGQSCVTLTPEEQAARDEARAARQAESAQGQQFTSTPVILSGSVIER